MNRLQITYRISYYILASKLIVAMKAHSDMYAIFKLNAVERHELRSENPCLSKPIPQRNDG